MKTQRSRGVLSEINVTPLVDVMLVLLVIFMVTAPLLQQGVDVDLPQSKGKELPPEERFNVVIKKDRTVLLNKEVVTIPELRKKLESISRTNPNIFLKADKEVPYGFVVEIMGEIKEAGIEKLGMITTPKLSTE